MPVENRLAWAGGISLLIALILFVRGVRDVSRQQFRSLPDPAKTPGLAIPLTVEEACSESRSLNVAASVQKSVFDHYGIDRPTPETYELDFLIPPTLGGTSDEKNLWPQPKGRIAWNAEIKNALEEHLRELVCNRTITIEEARNALAKDWIVAYQHYFQTRLPLGLHQRR